MDDLIVLRNNEGYFSVDFEKKELRWYRSNSEIGKDYGLNNLKIKMEYISGIEIEQPFLTRCGRIVFIIKNKRLIEKLHNFPYPLARFHFFPNEATVIQTISDRIQKEFPHIQQRGKNGFNVETVLVKKGEYQDKQAKEPRETIIHNDYKKNISSGKKRISVLLGVMIAVIFILLAILTKSCSGLFPHDNPMDDIMNKDPNEWTDGEQDYVDGFFDWLGNQ